MYYCYYYYYIYKHILCILKCITSNTTIFVFIIQIKDMNHENLNAFLGACVEPPNICILSGYCSKGNLQVSLNTHWDELGGSSATLILLIIHRITLCTAYCGITVYLVRVSVMN